MLWPYEI